MSQLYTTYQYRYDQGEILLNRTEAAIAKTADYIFNEADTVDDHPERLAWAKHVLINSRTRQMAESMLWSVVANATIAAKLEAGGEANVPDSDIEYVISVNAAVWGATLL